MANTLFLRLEGPLQSWGEDSQWSERRTAPEPTKSGIVGLLACALGWKDDARIRQLSHGIRIGVRVDVPGTPAPLKDYHTVGGALTAKGEPKRIPSTGKPHTEPTWRYYLCDASFLVAIQSDSGTIEELAQAIQTPVWPVFLGRKCCIPTRPPFDGMNDHASLADALQQHPARWLREDPRQPVSYPRIVVECEPLEAGSIRRRDQLVSRSYRRFEPRYSREQRAERDTHAEYLKEGV